MKTINPCKAKFKNYTQGGLLRAQSYKPCLRGVAPLIRGEAPRMRGEAPLTRGVAPRMRGVAPLTRGAAPREQFQVFLIKNHIF